MAVKKKKLKLISKYIASFVTEVTERMLLKKGFSEILIALLKLLVVNDSDMIKDCAKQLFKYEDEKADESSKESKNGGRQ